MVFDDSHGQAESQSGAFSKFLGGEKRLKQLFPMMLWNSLSAVDHSNF